MLVHELHHAQVATQLITGNPHLEALEETVFSEMCFNICRRFSHRANLFHQVTSSALKNVRDFSSPTGTGISRAGGASDGVWGLVVQMFGLWTEKMVIYGMKTHGSSCKKSLI